MSNLDQDQLQPIAKELAKNVKTQDDLSNLSSMLVKMIVEATLGAEMEEHLGYAKHQGSNSANSRNGYSKKTLKGNHGAVDITVPRDRDSSFEPSIIKKGENRLTSMDDQILAIYAKGMSTRDIVATFKKMYNAEISASLVSKVSDPVLDKVIQWRSRPLDEVYPVLYLDGIVIKIRQDKQVIRKTMYIALGVNLEGQKECLGLCLSVLNDISNRTKRGHYTFQLHQSKIKP